MEFIIFSDMHYSLGASKSYIRSDGIYSWLYEQIQVTHQIFNYARENGIELVIHNGDFFEDKNRINVGLYNLVWSLYKELSKEFEIIFNMGNHDISTFTDSSLKPFSDIAMVVSDRYDGIYERDHLRILAYSHAYQNLTKPEDIRSILVTHEEISGLKLGPTDYESGAELKQELFGDWDIVFNGHIHKPQTLKNIINIGSTMHRDWGEAGEEKRFIHYKDGEVKSIPIDCFKFIIIPEFTDEIRELVWNDDRNFYRIDISANEVKDEVFSKYNVSYNIIKTEKREVRMPKTKTIDDELKRYIEIKNSDLDVEKLLTVGRRLIK